MGGPSVATVVKTVREGRSCWKVCPVVQGISEQGLWSGSSICGCFLTEVLWVLCLKVVRLLDSVGCVLDLEAEVSV